MKRITVLLLFLASIAHAQQKDFALTNANLFNGIENKIYADVVVFVKNGKIERIGRKGDPIAGNYTIVDCEGNYLLPGLMDVHTHLDNLESARRALHSGVTTVRSASVSAYQDVAIREMAKSGIIPGPDMVACGVYVTPHLGETILADPRLGSLYHGVNTDEELRKLVNVNIDRGANVIKTRGTERAGRPDTDPREQTYTEHQLKVIVDEAAKRDVPIMIHAHGDEGARAAVMAGARSIEHGTFLKDETFKLMKEKGTFLVPTFITLEDLVEPGGDYDDPVVHLRGKFMMPLAEKVFKKAHGMGIKIATGADNGYTAKTTSRISLEVAHFARMGMTNFEAIQSATVVSTELLRLDKQTGRIATGYDADMILVPGNPLEDINALQDVIMVMSNGQMALKRLPFGKN
ncbi:MAG TPA: amidohydrolase family protein [Cyclobacteriaceae bacterium]|nr:amidohydrolase family protein [Cyclobacteriaceae bacterium]